MLSNKEKATKILTEIEPHVDKIQVAAASGLHPQTVDYLMKGSREPRKKDTLPKLYKAAVDNFIEKKDWINSIDIPFRELSVN